MKSKMPVVLAIASRSARVAKEKARTTIRTATISKPRMSHAFITVHTSLDLNLSSIFHSRFTESTLSNESSNVDESFNERETFIQNIQEIIQGSITKALAIRDRKEKNGNFAIDLSTILVVEECFANIDTVFSSFSSFISLSTIPQ